MAAHQRQQDDNDIDPGSRKAMLVLLETSLLARASVALCAWGLICVLAYQTGLFGTIVQGRTLPPLPTIETWEDVPFMTENDVNFFFDAAYAGDAPIAVMFYADWCGHCKKMKPIFAEWAASTRYYIRALRVDVDANKDLSRMFKVKGYPTVMFLSPMCSELLSHGVAEEDVHPMVGRKFDGERSVAGLENFARETLGVSYELRVAEPEHIVFLGSKHQAKLVSHCIFHRYFVDEPMRYTDVGWEEGMMYKPRGLAPGVRDTSFVHLVEMEKAESGELLLAKQYFVWGPVLFADNPEDALVIPSLNAMTKLPLMFVPFGAYNDFHGRDGQITMRAGHVIVYRRNQTGVRAALQCGDDEPDCARLAVYKSKSYKLYDVAADDTDSGRLSQILDRTLSALDDGTLVELKIKEELVSSGDGTLVAEWTPGSVARMTSTSVEAWFGAIESGAVQGVLVCFTDPTCKHCVAYAPEFEHAADMVSDVPVVLATYDTSSNSFNSLLGDSIAGTPELRYLCLGANGKVTGTTVNQVTSREQTEGAVRSLIAANKRTTLDHEDL